MPNKSNKEIVLEVLKRAFIDRDPTVVEQYCRRELQAAQPGNPGWPVSHCEDDSDSHCPHV